MGYAETAEYLLGAEVDGLHYVEVFFGSQNCTPDFRGITCSTWPWMWMCCRHWCWAKTWEVRNKCMASRYHWIENFSSFSISQVMWVSAGFKIQFKRISIICLIWTPCSRLTEQESWEARPFREVQITKLAVTWTKTNSLCLWWLRERHLAYI